MKYILNHISGEITDTLREYLSTIYVSKLDALKDESYLKSVGVVVGVAECKQAYLSVREKQELISYIDGATVQELNSKFNILTTYNFKRLYLLVKYKNYYELITKKSFTTPLNVFEDADELIKIRNNIQEEGIHIITIYANNSIQVTKYTTFS